MQPVSRRYSVLWVSAVAAIMCLLLGVGYIMVRAYQTSSRAERALSRMASLQVGEEFTAGALTAADSSFTKKGNCEVECSYSFHFDNKELSSYLFARPTTFRGALRIESGKIIERAVSMTVDDVSTKFDTVRNSDTSREVFAETLELSCEECALISGPYEVIIKRHRNRTEKLVVNLTRRAPASIRQEAYRFNLKCLRTLSGCADAAEFLPGISESQTGGP
jgi:hypothetical protein